MKWGADALIRPFAVGDRMIGGTKSDVESDPRQTKPIQDAAVEKRMIEHLIRLMKECDAPKEQFERLGLK